MYTTVMTLVHIREKPEHWILEIISDPPIGAEAPQDIPPWEIIPPEELEDGDEDLF